MGSATPSHGSESCSSSPSAPTQSWTKLVRRSASRAAPALSCAAPAEDRSWRRGPYRGRARRGTGGGARGEAAAAELLAAHAEAQRVLQVLALAQPAAQRARQQVLVRGGQGVLALEAVAEDGARDAAAAEHEEQAHEGGEQEGGYHDARPRVREGVAPHDEVH